MRPIVCYVSGHGFGHAARVCTVLRVLRARRPDLRCMIRSPVPRWFFEFDLGPDIEHGHCALDVGVVQRDALSTDLEATLQAYTAIDTEALRRIEAEVAALAPHRPALVLGDIPALAFDVADRLGVPGVAMANFSWDWIYADYARDLPAFAPLVARLRASYARAASLLRLPMHGDLGAFSRIRDIPLVARRATVAPAAVRARLDLPREDRLVLLSFGGIGLELCEVPRLRGISFVGVGAVGPGCRTLAHPELTAAGVRYEDLVGACDAVMTKPGYGIVAECIANGTSIVYTPRGRFAEYACLVAAIEAHLPHAFVSNDDLRAGRWSAALDAVFAQERRAATMRLDGAEVAAAALASLR